MKLNTISSVLISALLLSSCNAKAQYDSLYTYIDSTVIIKGIIQTSGIQKFDKFDIEAEFQITNPVKSLFLVSEKDLSPYWGKCVQVTGKYVEGWDTVTEYFKNVFTFMRSAIYLDSIAEASSDYCFHSPYFRPQEKDQYETHYRDTIVKGYLFRTKRLAPDIGGDFGLRLEKPIPNHECPEEKIASLGVYLNVDLDTLNDIIENQKKVSLYGIFKGGYAESIIFSCKKMIAVE